MALLAWYIHTLASPTALFAPAPTCSILAAPQLLPGGILPACAACIYIHTLASAFHPSV